MVPWSGFLNFEGDFHSFILLLLNIENRNADPERIVGVPVYRYPCAVAICRCKQRRVSAHPRSVEYMGWPKKQILISISISYSSAGWFRQLMARNTMFGPLSLSSWDILYLFPYESPQPVPKGCETCRDRVTFEGQCVRASELNYIMYGWGIQVTGYPRWLGIDLLTEFLYYLGSDTDAQFANKVAFAKYGSDLSKPLPQGLGTDSCTIDRAPFRASSTDWQWMELKW